jgi:hypothetical protein
MGSQAFTVKRHRADLFTVHAPSELDAHGRQLGVASTRESAEAMCRRQKKLAAQERAAVSRAARKARAEHKAKQRAALHALGIHP